jgi:hypothetical protein
MLGRQQGELERIARYQQLIDDLIVGWDPAVQAVHCSNCRQTRVSGPSYRPVVRCEQGQGKEKTLAQLIRPSRPAYFRSALDCDFFERAD